MQDCKIKIIKLEFYFRKNGEMNMLTRKTKKVLAIVLTGAVALPGMAFRNVGFRKSKMYYKEDDASSREKENN